MKRFGYLADPVCLVACALYAFNRWWLAPRIGGVFLHGYFNDLLLIPAALPLVLWLQRKLGYRPHDQPPRWGEIGFHLLVWSVTAEAILPRMLAHATADWRDVIAYSSGALLAGCVWQVAPVG